MTVIHFLLNLAALLLWLTACGFGGEPPPGQPLTLTSHLKATENRRFRRWPYVIALMGLLGLRAVFYRHLGASIGWTPVWSLGAVAVPFRSDMFSRMLLYSLISFLWSWLTAYASLLLIAGANRQSAEINPLTRVIQRHLGRVSRWPALMQLALPFVSFGVVWFGVSWLLSRQGFLLAPRSPTDWLRQCLVVAVGGLLGLRWVLTGILVLGMANTYIYFGRQPFWDFIDVTFRGVMRPLRWLPLRIWRIDLAPLIALLLIWSVTWLLWEGMPVSVMESFPQWRVWHLDEPWLRRWYQGTP